ncbi:MAG: PDZ domain-containing protein [Planctomycetota bacterium]|nr:PDZ domain-containing protein [Planctomycetota bacterium]
MNYLQGAKALILILLLSMISALTLASAPIAVTGDTDGITLDDDLKEIEARFNAELEKMRSQFREELQRAQVNPRAELRAALQRVEDLELENATLRTALQVAEVQLGALQITEQNEVAEVNSNPDRPRGQLGIQIIQMTKAQGAALEVKAVDSVLVEAITAGSTAEQMGLRAGDAIFELDGEDADMDQLISILSRKKMGDPVTIGWARKGDDGVMKVTGRGIMKPWQEKQHVTISIPATRLVEMAPKPPVLEMKSGIALGIHVIQTEEFGLEVVSVEPGSNGAVAGLTVGDMITGFAETQVRTIEGLRDVLNSTIPGVETVVSFNRKGNPWTTRVRFGGGDLVAVRVGDPTSSSAGSDAAVPVAGVSEVPGFLGVAPVEKQAGVFVDDVIAGSCAEAMKLQSGDRLTSIEGMQVQTIDDLRHALLGRKAGENIVIGYVRADGAHTVAGVLGSYPTAEGQSSVNDEELEGAAPVAASASIADVLRDSEWARNTESARTTPGPLGIIISWDADGALIDAVLPGSDAGMAGAEVGDRLVRIDGVTITSLEEIGDVLTSIGVGSPVAMEVLRGDQVQQLVAHRAELEGLDPQQAEDVVTAAADLEPQVLGIEVEENAIGILLTDIHEGSLAEAAGLKRGDWIIRICEMEVRSIEDIQDSLQYSGLIEIQMTIRRDLDLIEVSIPLSRR